MTDAFPASPATSLSAPAPASQPGAATTRFADLETFCNLLGEAQAVELTLPGALRFILQITDRASGLIFLQSPPAIPANWTTHCNAPLLWLNQIADPASDLRRLILHSLADPLAAAPELGVAAVIPIAAPAREGQAQAAAQLGVIVLGGAPCALDEFEWLKYVGRFIARAIQRNQLFAASQDRSQELAALHKIASTLTSTLQLDEILSGTVDGICQILNVEAASLLLLDETRGELVFKKALGGSPDWIFQYSLKVGRGLAGEAVRTGQPVLANDVQTDPRFHPDLDSLAGVDARNLLCAPLMTRGQTLGAIAVINKREGPFNLHDQELLASMTASVANAIHHARLFHQLTVANADLEASRWEVIRSRSTLQALFDGITSPIYIVDRDYQLVAVNLACARMARASGVTEAPAGEAASGSAAAMQDEEKERQALLNRRCFQVLFGRQQICPGCRVADTLHAGQGTQRAERRWDSAEQPTEWEISTYPIRDEKGQLIQVIVLNQEVTEKHRLETSLAQSEKMAAVGQLAAGVAHDINNPLSAIIANTQLLQRDLQPDDERQESLELIAKAGDRAVRVVRNLLDFARQDHYEFAATDVNDSFQSALDLFEHQLVTHAITLTCNLAPDLPLIQASHDHLQSVWLNLLLNARDAFGEDGGEIRITTSRQGNEVNVAVSDTGMGIPPERLTRIFEPFYTTKQAGHGTGLGLSLCQRIVKQHGGRIQVDSQVGRGTAFTISLPITQPAASI